MRSLTTSRTRACCKERRRALHAAVGDAIHELYADRPPELDEILAHHFERAERWDKAVEYLAPPPRKSFPPTCSPRLFSSRAERALDIGERFPGRTAPVPR